MEEHQLKEVMWPKQQGRTVSLIVVEVMDVNVAWFSFATGWKGAGEVQLLRMFWKGCDSECAGMTVSSLGHEYLEKRPKLHSQIAVALAGRQDGGAVCGSHRKQWRELWGQGKWRSVLAVLLIPTSLHQEHESKFHFVEGSQVWSSKIDLWVIFKEIAIDFFLFVCLQMRVPRCRREGGPRCNCAGPWEELMGLTFLRSFQKTCWQSE